MQATTKINENFMFFFLILNEMRTFRYTKKRIHYTKQQKADIAI